MQKKTIRLLGIVGAVSVLGIGYAKAQNEVLYRAASVKYELNQNGANIDNVVDALEKAPESHAVLRDVAHMAILTGDKEIKGETSMGISQMMLQEKIVNQNETLIAQNERLIGLHEKEVGLLTQIAKKK
jgi:hypothetical protein